MCRFEVRSNTLSNISTCSVPGFHNTTYLILAQSHFEGGTLVKIAFRGEKYTFGGVPLVRFAFSEAKYHVFGSKPQTWEYGSVPT